MSINAVSAEGADARGPTCTAASLQRQLRVLISAPIIGGAGGTERAVHALSVALEGHQVTVVAGRIRGGEWGSFPSHTTVEIMREPRWRLSNRGPSADSRRKVAAGVLNPIRRHVYRPFDVYIQFGRGQSVVSNIRASLRLIVPAGTRLTAQDCVGFSYAVLEAPSNDSLVPSSISTLLIPPPLVPLATESIAPTHALPEAFFLTVFNPYGDVKGVDDLLRFLGAAPFPLVWCHSRQSAAFTVPESVLHHPMLIQINDPSPAQMRFLYEGCRAYVCFSKSEGFGWSVVDALHLSRAVASRETGIMSFPESRQAGVFIVPDFSDLGWVSQLAVEQRRPERDLSWLEPGAFARQVEALAERSAHRG